MLIEIVVVAICIAIPTCITVAQCTDEESINIEEVNDNNINNEQGNNNDHLNGNNVDYNNNYQEYPQINDIQNNANIIQQDPLLNANQTFTADISKCLEAIRRLNQNQNNNSIVYITEYAKIIKKELFEKAVSNAHNQEYTATNNNVCMITNILCLFKTQLYSKLDIIEPEDNTINNIDEIQENNIQNNNNNIINNDDEYTELYRTMEYLDKNAGIFRNDGIDSVIKEIAVKCYSKIRDIRKKKLEEEEKIREEKKKLEEEEKKKIENEFNAKANEAKNKLVEEPSEDNPDCTTIRFRYPDGEKTIERRFLKNNTVQNLYDYVTSLGRDIYTEKENSNFFLQQPVPPKKYENMENTLEMEGLFPRAVIQIKEE